MNEIAVRESATMAPTDPTGGRLVAWATAAHAANQLAKALARTPFAPKDFQGKEGDATAAILMGDELGLSPLASLRSIYVIHGTPAMYARTMVALALSHGHEIWTEKSTDTEVVVCGRRRGMDHIERSVWTIARARTAGYTNNKKYASNPQEMLYSKAAAEVSKKVAADVLAGIPYSVEDIELDQPAATSTVSRSDRKTTAKRAAAAVAEEPDFEPPPVSKETGEAISAPQLKKLHALLNENDLADRDAGLAYLGGLIGRELESSKDLTKAEASVCIDRLELLSADPLEPDQATLDAIERGE